MLFCFLCLISYGVLGQDLDNVDVIRGEFINEDYRLQVEVYPVYYPPGTLIGSWELEKYSLGIRDAEPEHISLECNFQAGYTYTAESADGAYELQFSGIVTEEGTLEGDLHLTGPDSDAWWSSVAEYQDDVSGEYQDDVSFAQTGQPDRLTWPLVMAGMFFISFILLSWYLKKIYNQLYQTGEGGVESFSQYYPMVRISRRSFLWRHRVFILYGDMLVVFKKWKWKSIQALHEPDSRNLFNKSEKRQAEYIHFNKKDDQSGSIHKVKGIGFDDIRQVVLYPSRIMRTHLIKIRTRYGKFKVVLPDYECTNFIKALREVVPGKVRYARVNLFWRALVAALLTLIVFYFIYASLTPVPLLGQGLVWVAILVMGCILPILFVKYDLYKLKSAGKGKKPSKDRSHSKPLRSNALAHTLRILAVASFGLYLYNQFIPWKYEAILCGSILWISIALSRKKTDVLRENDTRKPILYLRSFRDDNETTLSPCTGISSTLGVDPPYYWLTNQGIEEGLRYKIGRFIIKYGYSFWPSRLIRLLFGNPLDTSEEQLTNYFKQYGLVVAIGKPGEKITTLGASRMYVTNDEWKQTVLDLLQESQLALIQPSSTDGVWWEIDKAFNKCEPERIILCMVNYKNHQESYEIFYQKLKTLKPNLNIPRSIGNDRQISFLTFNKDWQPEQLKLKYYSKFRWFFTGNALNLNETFDGFFNQRRELLRQAAG